MSAITRRALLSGSAVVALAWWAGLVPALAATGQVLNETAGTTPESLHAALAAAAPGMTSPTTGSR